MVDVQILKDARELIARPGGWTQLVHARNKRGDTVDITSESAVSFCAIGALVRVAKVSERGIRLSTNERVAVWRATDAEDFLPDWNDDPDRTQAEVVAAFDKAIAAAEAEAAQ